MTIKTSDTRIGDKIEFFFKFKKLERKVSKIDFKKCMDLGLSNIDCGLTPFFLF